MISITENKKMVFLNKSKKHCASCLLYLKLNWTMNNALLFYSINTLFKDKFMKNFFLMLQGTVVFLLLSFSLECFALSQNVSCTASLNPRAGIQVDCTDGSSCPIDPVSKLPICKQATTCRVSVMGVGIICPNAQTCDSDGGTGTCATASSCSVTEGVIICPDAKKCLAQSMGTAYCPPSTCTAGPQGICKKI